MARVVEGLSPHIFHWLVPPVPISCTEQRRHYDECQYAATLGLQVHCGKEGMGGGGAGTHIL